MQWFPVDFGRACKDVSGAARLLARFPSGKMFGAIAVERVLITGAAGGIGRRIRPLLRGVYPMLRLSDRVAVSDIAPGETFVSAELDDLAAVERAVAGSDGIIHLGGISVENDWPAILRGNIIGTYNLFEAARRQGVRRVVFASSNHAVGFYRRRRRIGTNVLPRPDTRYGVSKAYGEALGAFYADKFGPGVLCIRIGNVDDKPVDKRRLSIWIHPEDLAALMRIGLDHPDLGYAVVYGASDNDRSWWDNAVAYELGYHPRHRAEEHREEAMAAQARLPPDPVGDIFQGGAFCSTEYAGDPDRSGS
jgi:uronate dehydrogenase